MDCVETVVACESADTACVIEALTAALDRASLSPSERYAAHIARAGYLAQGLEINAAMADYRAARALFPALTGPIIGEAVTLASAHVHDQALPLFDEALRREPGVPQILVPRAHTLGELRRYDEAIADLTTAIVIVKDKGTSDPDVALGVLYTRRGEMHGLAGRKLEAAADHRRAMNAAVDHAGRGDAPDGRQR